MWQRVLQLRSIQHSTTILEIFQGLLKASRVVEIQAFYLFLADLDDNDSDYMLPMINMNQLPNSSSPLNGFQSEEVPREQQQQADIDDDYTYVYFEKPLSKWCSALRIFFFVKSNVFAELATQ